MSPTPYPNTAYQEVEEPANLQRLARLLRQVHDLPAIGTSLDVVGMAHRYRDWACLFFQFADHLSVFSSAPAFQKRIEDRFLPTPNPQDESESPKLT